MKRHPLIIAAITLALGAATAPATCNAADAATPDGVKPRPKLALESEITNPDWISLPTGDQLGIYYPKLAQFLSLTGFVKMSCDVTNLGSLAGCKVVSEKPAGMGFGNAALEIAQFFRMKPQTLDGQPAYGGNVPISIKFQLPSDAPQAPLPADRPAPSPAAMALARRLVATANVQANWTKYFSMSLTNLRNGIGSDADTPEAKVALDAYAASGDRAAADVAETVAKQYAQTYSPAQLKVLVAFFESPTGRAWTTRQANDPAAALAMQAMMRQVAGAAAQALCLKTACP